MPPSFPQGARASDPHINPNRLLPAGFSSLLLKDWVLSPGLTFQSQANKKVNYALTLSKAPQFIRHSPKLDCWLTGKAHLLIDPKTAEVRDTSRCACRAMPCTQLHTTGAY